MIKYSFLIALTSFYVFPSFAKESATSVPPEYYQIVANKPCQTIDGFGASDAWSMRYLVLWPKKQQEHIADWQIGRAHV